MNMVAHRQLPPTAQESAVARDLVQSLFPYVRENRPISVKVNHAAHAPALELPSGIAELLMEILEAVAAGRGVTIIPEDAELTTVQAADILNVSRPYLIKLLEEEMAIPYRKVGKHRRIRMEDVMNYKQAIDQEREAVLDELVEEAQAQDMGYSLP